MGFLTDDRPWSALFLNKGFILFEELLKASFQDSSYKMKLLISKTILQNTNYCYWLYSRD